MTTTAVPSSSIKSAPKKPDPARRHYVALALRLRAALVAARAEASDPDAVTDLRERLGEARELAGRARAWGRRADGRARLVPGNAAPTGRRKGRPLRTAPITARDAEILTDDRMVPAPYAPGTYETVAFNAGVDILERERRHFEPDDRDAMIQAGRMCQALWERGAGGRMGSSMGALGRTNAADHELAVALAADDARKVRDFNAAVVQAVGECGLRVLRRYLVEGQTFRGHCGLVASERMVSQEAAYFRRTLANLADALGATGPDRSRIRSSHALA